MCKASGDGSAPIEPTSGRPSQRIWTNATFMPWNDNSNPGSGGGGPWGSPPPSGQPTPPTGGGSEGKPPPKSPWGGGGGGPNPPRKPQRPLRRPSLPGGGPDLDGLTRRAGERVRQFFTGPGGRGVNKRSVGLVAAGVGGLWLMSGVYVVQTNEEAVVTQFGAYSRTTGPGLGYRIPWPFERVQKLPVTTLQPTNVGGGEGADRVEESMMITADENIVDLDFTVQWRINDAAKYLFNIADQEATVKMVAESAMREVVGRTAPDPIISTGRGQVQQQTLVLMQQILDQYDAGVQVVEVQIRNANPPRDVIAAFREVASASQDAESAINEANAYRNRVVNEAKGDAARIRQASEGYRERVTREAEGQAARFNQVYAEYRQAPGVTRDRLYLETMERVLRSSNKLIVDGNGATAPVILPPDLFRRGQAETPPVAAGQTAPATATPQTAGAAR